MHNKLIDEIKEYSEESSNQYRMRLNACKQKQAFRVQRTIIQKKLFGNHFNHSKVALNQSKKYCIQEQKNTQIQRSNRILLAKIQTIAKRSGPNDQPMRILTENGESTFHSEQHQARNFNTVSRSVHHLQKVQENVSKTGRGLTKVLNQGSLSLEGKLSLTKTLVQNNRIVVYIDFGRIRQKIEIGIQTYRKLFRQKMESDHSKIVELLTFNGKYWQLPGVANYKVSIEEQSQVVLPAINKRSLHKDDTGSKERLKISKPHTISESEEFN